MLVYDSDCALFDGPLVDNQRLEAISSLILAGQVRTSRLPQFDRLMVRPILQYGSPLSDFVHLLLRLPDLRAG